MTKILLTFFCSVLLAIGMQGASARADGNSILINAKQIHLDQVSKKMTYRGSVRIRHQGLEIHGQQAIATGIASGARKVVVTGSPVRADYTDKLGRRVVITGQQLSYDSGTRILDASGKVIISNLDGTLRGDSASYNIATERFSLSAGGQSRVSALLSTIPSGQQGNEDQKP